MRQTHKIAMLIALSAGYAQAEDTSRSFFSIRPVGADHAHMDILADQHHGKGAIQNKKKLQITPFVSGSARSNEITKMMLFNGRTELRVKEGVPTAGTTTEELGQDFLAGNLNFRSAGDDYEGTLTFNPKHLAYGAAVSLHVPFQEYYWCNIEGALVHVKNDLNMEEIVKVDGGAAHTTARFGSELPVNRMAAAFADPNMTYGKIDGKKEKTGLPDLTIKLGMDSIDRGDLHMSSYVGAILPTSNKPKAKHLWEAITGNNGHAGLMVGSQGHLHVKNRKNAKLWLSWSAESQFLFQNKQKRMLDLKNRPWSRYLSMFANDADRAINAATSATWGANIMTRDVKVSPRYNGTFNTALNYMSNKWFVGGSYATHIRQAEHLELDTPWESVAEVAAYNVVLAPTAVNYIRGIGTGSTGSNDTTASNVITADMLDLGSAAMPNVLSHKIAFHCGCVCVKEQAKMFKERTFDTGASYEFARQNSALNRWALWASANCAF